MRRLLLLFSSVLAHWRVCLLALVTSLVWVAHYDRWTSASWGIPTEYAGDALEVLTRIQAAREGDTVPLRPQVISRLGAPFGANWSAYPSSDLLLIWAIGRLADVVGVFPAANLAMLFATVSAALALYGCARWLRTRWEWAFTAALLYAFTFQTFHRGLPHLFFLFSWTVPPALLVCGLVASSRQLRWPGWTAGFCILTSLVLGASNPYTLFLFLQLLGWALIAQWLGPRRSQNLIIGGGALAVAISAFFIVESHVWLFTPDTAANSPLARNYGGTEHYALKPLELLLPPATHRWEALAFFGHRYERWSEWRGGEAFAPYLGVIGIAGLSWLALTTVRAILRQRRLPGGALSAGWILAFSSVGGVTNMAAFFTGLLVFRATNRFSVFLSAIALLFLSRRLSRWAHGRPAWLSLGAAILVTACGLIDQLPHAPGFERQRRIALSIQNDRELGRLLENRLPPGAMVFQMPVMAFPEIVAPHELGDYDYFRPYLATQSLRFSYGILKGSSRGRWQRDTEALPTAEFVQRLERYGFAALYFDRRGFADRGAKLLSDLAAAGRTRWFEGPLHEQVVVLLEPAGPPEPPRAQTLTFGQGWQNPIIGEPRWAYGPAALSYFNPHSYSMPTRVRLTVSGQGERTLVLRVNGREEILKHVDSHADEIAFRVILQPGVNRVDLDTREPAVRLSQARGQLRAFAVHATSVEFEATADRKKLQTLTSKL